MLGYAGKYLEVDLSHVTFKNTVFGDEVLKDYVGGRALATKIPSDRLIHKWDEVDPLESDNVLLLLTGPITGYFPGGRVCVSGKSPQSNGVVGSTVGGEFGVELRCAGYDGIIVTGKAEKPVYLFIKDSDVAIFTLKMLARAATDIPDYELQAFLGPNLGLFTPEENVYLAALVDDLGLCGIQTGSVMAFAAELYQRGVLTETDLDGIDLRWGNADAFAALVKKIAVRDGIGNILADGTFRAAEKLSKLKGQDLTSYAIHVKGISVGAHGVRSGRDFSRTVGYACSVQGGDHSSQTDLPIDGWGSEIWTIFNDSAILCIFNTFGISTEFKFDFYNAITGQTLTRKKWLNNGGMKTLQTQRALLLLGGPDLRWNPTVDDDIPSRFYEPLPTGPYKGKAADRTSVKQKIEKYYEQAGWDKDGIPTKETLRRLNLDDIDEALEFVHK